MAVYSISDLEKLSGIKAHTIRMWEQRHGILEPQRTSSNIRYYEDDDLKHLLNVALLNKNGIKISKIAAMTRVQVIEKVAAIAEVHHEQDTQSDALTLAMIELDEYKFDRVVSTRIQQMGFERMMMELIFPFLEKLSLLWMTGSIHPVQENFISNLIRQKLICAIDREPLPSSRQGQKFLLYLPEGERQELSLLFMHYLLKARRQRVIYLGLDVSVADLTDAYHIHQPSFIFTMINETFTRQPVQHYISALNRSFPKAQILLSGYQVIQQGVEEDHGVHILRSIDNTLAFLNEISGLAPGPRLAAQQSE